MQLTDVGGRERIGRVPSKEDTFLPGTEFKLNIIGNPASFVLILSEDKKKYGLYVMGEDRIWGPDSWAWVEDPKNLLLSRITAIYNYLTITHIPIDISLNKKIIGILNGEGNKGSV